MLMEYSDIRELSKIFKRTSKSVFVEQIYEFVKKKEKKKRHNFIVHIKQLIVKLETTLISYKWIG